MLNDVEEGEDVGETKLDPVQRGTEEEYNVHDMVMIAVAECDYLIGF